MADLTVILVELAFVLSLVGFITVIIMIPKKKDIEEGRAGHKMASPLVPIIIGSGALAAGLELVIAFFANSDDVMYAGIVSSILLILVYVLIFLEFRSMKKHIAKAAPHLDHATIAGVQHDHMMTVECPRCGKHLSIVKGATEIVCPHCGLTGSL